MHHRPHRRAQPRRRRAAARHRLDGAPPGLLRRRGSWADEAHVDGARAAIVPLLLGDVHAVRGAAAAAGPRRARHVGGRGARPRQGDGAAARQRQCDLARLLRGAARADRRRDAAAARLARGAARRRRAALVCGAGRRGERRPPARADAALPRARRGDAAGGLGDRDGRGQAAMPRVGATRRARPDRRRRLVVWAAGPAPRGAARLVQPAHGRAVRRLPVEPL